jgi:hypothetical protein
MGLTRSLLCALGLAAAAAVQTGCGDSAPPTEKPPQLPAAAQSGELLYVSDPADNNVSFYSYPGLKFKGKLRGLRYPTGLCTDARSQNIWVISGNSAIEFAHGATKRIRTLKVDVPEIKTCAVNPTNGDLAITELTEYDDAGKLLVLKNGSGKPLFYQSNNLFFYSFVGYDADGDVFVDGRNSSGAFRLDELPEGSTKFANVTPHRVSVRAPGGIAYDGANMVVGDARRRLVYRTEGRKVVGTTRLSESCVVQQFAIIGDVLLAPNFCRHHGEVLVYGYPSGGLPGKKITGLFEPFAVAVSL